MKITPNAFPLCLKSIEKSKGLLRLISNRCISFEISSEKTTESKADNYFISTVPTPKVSETPSPNLEFTLQKMMEAGMHLGHASNKLNRSMVPYILGERDGIHIIDLDKTLPCLKLAMNVIKDISKENGIILWVGTRPFISSLTCSTALSVDGNYFIAHEWLKGTLTNRNVVLKDDASPLPDLLVVLSNPANLLAIEEAERVKIPVISICDTDCNANLVDYPIPANDDSYASVHFIANALAKSAQEGITQRKFKQEEGSIFQSFKKFSTNLKMQ